MMSLLVPRHGALEVQPVKKKERSAQTRSREKPGQTSKAREVCVRGGGGDISGGMVTLSLW